MGQNPTEDELLALVMEVDINGDGTIGRSGTKSTDYLIFISNSYNKKILSPDFNEFLGMMKSKANEADQESDLREAFKIFDKDKNGYIDMKELKQVKGGIQN